MDTTNDTEGTPTPAVVDDEATLTVTPTPVAAPAIAEEAIFYGEDTFGEDYNNYVPLEIPVSSPTISDSLLPVSDDVFDLDPVSPIDSVDVGVPEEYKSTVDKFVAYGTAVEQGLNPVMPAAGVAISANEAIKAFADPASELIANITGGIQDWYKGGVESVSDNLSEEDMSFVKKNVTASADERDMIVATNSERAKVGLENLTPEERGVAVNNYRTEKVNKAAVEATTKNLFGWSDTTWKVALTLGSYLLQAELARQQLESQYRMTKEFREEDRAWEREKMALKEQYSGGGGGGGGGTTVSRPTSNAFGG